MLTEEAANINCIVFGLTRTGFEHIICHTRCEHANNYTIEAMQDVIEETNQHMAPV
jgi:hypothetical protein